jgi:DNA-binding transcriptional LysR family regulator
LQTAALTSRRRTAAMGLQKRLAMNINWDDLRILAAVQECGTYAAASKALKLDETTVARRLSRLEISLGLKLLDAIDGRRRPTQAAQGLLRHLEAMSRHVDDILRIGQATATQGLSGRVRIAATNAVAEEVLAPRLAELLVNNPGLVIDLLTSTHTVNFSRWEADLAIRLVS